jgi:putative SOS response-associated peptidase YedK
MCARYTLSTPPDILAKLFDVGQIVNIGPRYNIAPTQEIPTVRLNMQGQRELALLRWGLIPSWANDHTIGTKHLNARAETVGEKPSFREAIRHRRCIIPADGFFEWQATESGKKQPFLICRSKPQVLAFAGIWDAWESPKGKLIETCSILTVAANSLLRPLHDRMPLILEARDYSKWLDRGITRMEELKPIMKPLASEEMTMYPVSMRVNNTLFDDPICVQRLPETGTSERQLTLW